MIGIQIYIVSAIFTLLFGIVVKPDDNITRKKVYSLVMFLLWGFIMACRHNTIGVDTLMYATKIFPHYAYAPLNLDNMKNGNMPLYFLFNKLVAVFSLHPNAIILACSLIIMLGYALFIYNFSENLTISWYCFLVFYFYFFAMNGMRQSVSIALLLISTVFFAKNKRIATIIFFIAAILIHPISIAFVLYYFLPKLKLSLKVQMFILGILIFGKIFLDKFIELFIYFFPKFQLYTLSGSLYDEANGRKIILTFIYLILVIIAEAGIRRKNTLTIEKKIIIKTNIYTVTIVIITDFMFGKFLLFDRVFMPFEVFIILLIPNIVENFIAPKAKAICYLGVILVFFIPLYIQLSGNYSGVVPYRFFWQ